MYSLLALLLLAVPLKAHAEELELTVHLHTSSKRHPAALFLEAHLPNEFRQALEMAVMHGGFFSLPAGHGDLEKQLKEGIDTPGLASKLARSGLSYGLTLWKEGDRCRLDSISHEGLLCSSLTYVIPNDPQEQRRLAHRLGDELHQALFQRPPIGQTKILYVLSPDGKTGGQTELWECDIDGSGARKILSDQHCCICPSYLPPSAGKRSDGFALVSYRFGPAKIMKGRIGTGSMERLSTLPGNQFHPTFSPQRDRIAFICDATGNPDLFIQSFSPERGLIGKARQIFTAARSVQASPCFSPNGKQVAFVSDKDGGQKIYILDIPPPETPLKEIRPHCISRRNRENTAPAWSPDGRYIAYCAKVDGVRQIWITDLQSGEEKALTSGPQHKENPSWAPDSLHLIFNSVAVRQSELYITSLHEEGAWRISSGAGLKRFPVWEPRYPLQR
jgi:TolB protein